MPEVRTLLMAVYPALFPFSFISREFRVLFWHKLENCRDFRSGEDFSNFCGFPKSVQDEKCPFYFVANSCSFFPFYLQQRAKIGRERRKREDKVDKRANAGRSSMLHILKFKCTIICLHFNRVLRLSSTVTFYYLGHKKRNLHAQG